MIAQSETKTPGLMTLYIGRTADGRICCRAKSTTRLCQHCTAHHVAEQYVPTIGDRRRAMYGLPQQVLSVYVGWPYVEGSAQGISDDERQARIHAATFAGDVDAVRALQQGEQ